MDIKRPQLRLRAVCPVNGRSRHLQVSPDATRLFVLDEEANWLGLISLPGFQFIRRIDLTPYRGGWHFFLASRGETLYCRGRCQGILAFDTVSEQFREAGICGGWPCDLMFIPGGRHAQVTVSSGDTGGVELFDAERNRRVVRLDLPMSPLEGTLALSPDGSLGAAILRCPPGGETRVACWSLDPLRLRFDKAVGGGACSVVFDADGRKLYVACHRDSEVVEVDAGSGNITQRLIMAGRPFQVWAERRGRTAWVLCESLGNLAIADVSRGTITASIPLRGVKDPGSRLATSPEGKLAVVPAGEGVALVNSDAGGGRYGQLEDLLELGRDVAHAVWSPLGDEIFLGDAGSGDVLALSVDRGDVAMDDTARYLSAQVRRDAIERGGGPFLPNPLFPP